jgi:hypothetical protein
MLLRAGQSPLEPRLDTAPGGDANRKRATPIKLVGSRKESIPPGTWTESGRTPVLAESSNSRERCGAGPDGRPPAWSTGIGNTANCR